MRFQIVEQIGAVFFAQWRHGFTVFDDGGGAVLVAGVAVAWQAGVIGEAGVVLAPHSHLDGIELARSDLEGGWPALGLLVVGRARGRQQQVVQGWHRAVVQIGRRDPDTVQRAPLVGVQGGIGGDGGVDGIAAVPA